MITCSRPVLWLLSSPSISVLFAMRGCPLTSTRQRILRVEELRSARGAAGVEPGHGDQQRLEVAVEGQRQLRHHLRLDDAPGVGAVRLQQRRLRRDRDRLRQLPDFEPQIDADRRVDVDFDALRARLS